MLESRQPPMIRFTLSDNAVEKPTIVAAAAADGDFQWQGPAGEFTGKSPAVENFVAGSYILRSRAWGEVTTLNFGHDTAIGKITAFTMHGLRQRLRKLTYIKISQNRSLVGSLRQFFLPGLTDVLLDFTSLTGSVEDYTPTAGLVNFMLKYNQIAGVTGDVSNLVPVSTIIRIWCEATRITYGTGGLLSKVTRNVSYYYFNDCLWNLTMADQALADLVASNTTGGILNIGGTNAAPTNGVNNANRLELVNNRSWTVTVTA
jgi:hypothetical protein